MMITHTPDSPRPEDPGQFGGGDLLELGVGARRRGAVLAEAEEVGGMAEPVALEVVVADLHHLFRADRFPAHVLPGVPAALSARDALTPRHGGRPLRPGMAVEG